MRPLLVLFAIALAMGAATAGSLTPQIGGGISQFDGGIASQGSTVTPGSCSGVINAGSGCPLPMLGM
ncbi:hypothetical protein [Pseudomonas sp. EA_65y_Pfl1_P113]|uniref:hypothetical protein n=1 Tax=Pseudomonas sp. EA_65y_Pfl1_P113 TaxID=3088692 RepID=UPI0030DD60C9